MHWGRSRNRGSIEIVRYIVIDDETNLFTLRSSVNARWKIVYDTFVVKRMQSKKSMPELHFILLVFLNSKNVRTVIQCNAMHDWCKIITFPLCGLRLFFSFAEISYSSPSSSSSCSAIPLNHSLHVCSFFSIYYLNIFFFSFLLFTFNFPFV